MKICAKPQQIKLAKPFSIARGTRTHVEVVQVTVTYEQFQAHGECTPYPRYGESVNSVIEKIESASQALLHCKYEEARVVLQTLLPAGAARNAIDCALWRLEAIMANTGFPHPRFEIPQRITTAMTVSIDSPQAMGQQAKTYMNEGAKLLKVKLDAEQVIERVAAVRAAAPSAKIILDANEAWGALSLESLFHQLAELDIAMIEQPVAKGEDDLLAYIDHPIPICADESCHTREDIPALLQCYDMINIKLDKTGGLTEALTLEALARQHGLKIMVGCMLGTSRAMQAALPIAANAEIVDLDGPVLLGSDIPDGLTYLNGQIVCF
ncbi:L-Ala-D/L-Glu epimerase [Vibrio sp. Of7-15]|uniref:N-acetyl-D-Glu racemase DgcA n=1 Tax=Vibrio sp. Of7-15 TaxID=2724879 RepID=UPI001EF164F2|nr:N-acetyl-D-Glu racemase DgcA [Vibrio sp. Of7-15]MCG7499585.1 L-Ala-D/L-Glu epimerase [Vibrio sp. Of7-15]